MALYRQQIQDLVRKISSRDIGTSFYDQFRRD